jgi:hypothetical protein
VGSRWRGFPPNARSSVGGRCRAKRETLYHDTAGVQQKTFLFSVFRTSPLCRSRLTPHLSPTIRANLDPCATQAGVHSADGSSSICFLPHFASPTSPVKVRLPLARAWRFGNAIAEDRSAALAAKHHELRFAPCSLVLYARPRDSSGRQR